MNFLAPNFFFKSFQVRNWVFLRFRYIILIFHGLLAKILTFLRFLVKNLALFQVTCQNFEFSGDSGQLPGFFFDLLPLSWCFIDISNIVFFWFFFCWYLASPWITWHHLVFFGFLDKIFIFPKVLSIILSSFGFIWQNLSFSWISCEILDYSGIFLQDLVFWDFRPRPWLLHEILTACLFPWISGQHFFSEISYQKSNVSWISCQHLDSFGFPAEKSLFFDFLPNCRFTLYFLIIPWYLKGFFPSVWFFLGLLSVVLIFFGIPAKIMSPHEFLANFSIFLAFFAEISILPVFLVTVFGFF